MDTKIQPHDKGIEELVLGSIMSHREALHEVREILTLEAFYDPYHKSIYKAILSIDARGERPDMIAVCNELRKSDPNVDAYRIVQIAGNVTFDVYQHAAILHDKEKRRMFIDISERISKSAYDETVDIVDILFEAEESIKNVFNDSDNSVSTINDAIEGVKEQIERNHSTKGGLTGTPTGFSKFDEKSGGLQKSDFIVIAADTSQGKTSLSVCMALNAAISGASVAIYSMEMKKEQIAARMMSIKSGVPANQILYSHLLPEQFDRIDRGLSTLYSRKIYFDDRSTSSIDVIINSIRSLKKKYNIDGAIVDYLQILNVNMKGANKEQQMGEVARRLKNLAKELDIWIIALSQLNRDSINPIPSVTRLRDSGQIGEAADVILLIYRPEIYGKSYPEPFQTSDTNGTAMIDVAKGRNIGLLKFLCGFDKQTTRFYEIEENEWKSRMSQKEEESPF